MRHRCCLAVVKVQWGAKAQKGEAELGLLVEGLAAGDAQAIPLLTSCTGQEIPCGQRRGDVGRSSLLESVLLLASSLSANLLAPGILLLPAPPHPHLLL